MRIEALWVAIALGLAAVLLAIVLTVAIAGCGEAALIGGGVVAGAAGNQTLAGFRADLDAREQLLLVRKEAALNTLANSVTDAEKAAAQAKIAALEKQLELVQGGKEAAALAVKGTEVDWTAPAAVGGYAGTLIAAVGAWLLKKKKDETDARYSAMKKGVNKTLATTENSETLYANIGEARKEAGI